MTAQTQVETLEETLRQLDDREKQLRQELAAARRTLAIERSASRPRRTLGPLEWGVCLSVVAFVLSTIACFWAFLR